MMENRSDGMLNYRRFGFGYCKTETEPSDGFSHTPTGTVPKDIGREVKKVQGCTRMLGLKPIGLVIGKDRLTVDSRRIGCSVSSIRSQGRNDWGDEGDPDPQKKIWRDHPNFFDEECDYRYVTHCSARNWVYHPYFVLYSNLHQGIGPQL